MGLCPQSLRQEFRLGETFRKIVTSNILVVVVLPYSFREIGVWRNSMETQQSGHAPRSGAEVKNRRSSAKDGTPERLRSWNNPAGGELDPAEGVRRRCANVSPPHRGWAVPTPLTRWWAEMARQLSWGIRPFGHPLSWASATGSKGAVPPWIFIHGTDFVDRSLIVLFFRSFSYFSVFFPLPPLKIFLTTPLPPIVWNFYNIADFF